jgi:hypothetical protein
MQLRVSHNSEVQRRQNATVGAVSRSPSMQAQIQILLNWRVRTRETEEVSLPATVPGWGGVDLLSLLGLAVVFQAPVSRQVSIWKLHRSPGEAS